jgi:hypothetical protein
MEGTGIKPMMVGRGLPAMRAVQHHDSIADKEESPIRATSPSLSVKRGQVYPTLPTIAQLGIHLPSIRPHEDSKSI